MTVGTFFHHSHLDLGKWFRAILLVQNSSQRLSARKLAQDLGISKNTAAQVLKRLQEASSEDKRLLELIARHMRVSD